jgi:hypothetical protein
MATKHEVSNHFIRQMVNIAAYVALVVISVCAMMMPFNSTYLMDVVAQYGPDFMPAAYSWYLMHLVVFVFLLCFVVYQAMKSRRNDRVLRSIDYLFVVFVVANIVWTFGFFYQMQIIALIGMVAGAISAFLIYDRVGVGRDRVSNGFYWCVHFPFSIIAAATIFGLVSEISMFCIHYDLVWWGVTETAWNIIAILVVGFVGSLFLNYRPDVTFGLTLVWMSTGVAVYENNKDPLVTSFVLLLVLYFALISFKTAMHRPRLSKTTK